MAELASSVTCVANTGLVGKGSTTTVPGSKLLSKFQAADSSQVNNASHFKELGTLLLSQQGSSARFGTCNVMISSQTLRTQTRSLATQEILFKLSHGYNKGLWPVLHKDEPSANLVMPSDAADNGSRSQLAASLKDAVSHITSGRAASMLGTLLEMPYAQGRCFCQQQLQSCVQHHSVCNLSVHFFLFLLSHAAHTALVAAHVLSLHQGSLCLQTALRCW